MPLLVGTSGWQYRDWRDAFYPRDVPLSRWLDHYAATFPTVENNGTFYRLAKPETFAGWRARTPDGFLMAVKASRYLTHVLRLRDPAEPVGRLLTSCAGLGDRLGPVLLQLPPTMQAIPVRLICASRVPAQAARGGPARAGAARLRRVPPRVLVDAGRAAAAHAARRGTVLGGPPRAPARAALADRRLGLPAVA